MDPFIKVCRTVPRRVSGLMKAFGFSFGGIVEGNEEKLKGALKALKRVTVKQEMSLKTLRSKAKQRRAEIEQKEQIIEELKDETTSLKKAHKNLRGTGTDDVSALRVRLADLELQLARQEAGNEQQSKKLKESKEDITSLQSQLARVKGRVQRPKSLKSADSGASEDVVKAEERLSSRQNRKNHKSGI